MPGIFCLVKGFVSLWYWTGGERGRKRLYKVENLIPHFCSSLSWSVTEGQQHSHVSWWYCFMSSLKSLERRRKTQQNRVFWTTRRGWCLYQKPGSKALYLGAIHEEQGLLCCALYKHPGTAIPVTKDLLSKQRGQSKNSRRIRNELTSPELHSLVRMPERQKPGVLISSPFLTTSHLLLLWCLQGADGTRGNWLGIFNYWQLYIQAHTRWTRLPPGTVSPPGPKTAWRVLGWWLQGDIHSRNATPAKGREEGTALSETRLLKHLRKLQHKTKKLFVLWI